MNGSLVAEYEMEFVGPGMLAIISIKNGARLSIEVGDRFHVREDSYGNTYVYNEDGVEFYVNMEGDRWVKQ